MTAVNELCNVLNSHNVIHEIFIIDDGSTDTILDELIKLGVPYFFFFFFFFSANTARLLVEASFISHSQHELNGEEFWLKYSTLKFKNVIDAGANRGDWTSSLLSTRKEA